MSDASAGEPRGAASARPTAEWIPIARSVGSRPQPELDLRRALVWIAVSAILVVVGVAIAGLFAAQRLAESEAVNDVIQTAGILGETVIEPALDDGVITGDTASIARLDLAVRAHVLSDSIVRVKVWNSDGVILYSDEKRLIGRQFELEGEELEALDTSGVEAEVSDLSAPENLYEKDNVKLLEAHAGVRTPAGDRLLFESYVVFDRVAERSRELWTGFAVITLGSIVVLVLLFLPLVARLLSSLRLGQERRELLLRQALDASAAERRRIAGNLHDGVVQQLAATSFSLSGSAERASRSGADDAATGLRAAASSVRASMGSLRSLLVDIYPPSLETAGLAAVLADLASPLRARGVQVTIDLEEGLALGAERDRLVFRVVQEVLANTASHALADRVRITLGREGDRAVLVVTDDGIGFRVSDREHSAAGHFGLQVLTDLVADSTEEATLELRSAPGEGTAWRLAMVLDDGAADPGAAN